MLHIKHRNVFKHDLKHNKEEHKSSVSPCSG